MSGGYFDCNQFSIIGIADSIQDVIDSNNDEFFEATIAEFKTCVELLRAAAVYVQRIDYLLSSDDGEYVFHKRLNDDLNTLEQSLGE